MLTYEPETRKHTFQGRRVLSVTDILSLEGCYKGKDFFTEEKRQIGTYVHAACAFYDMDDLVEESLDDAIRGYVESYKKFFDLVKFQPIQTELAMYSQHYQFCGRPDVIGLINGERFVIDRKTGVSEQPADCLQTAAYQLLDSEREPIVVRRGSLYLKPDGSIPSWKPHNDKNDIAVFLSMLTSVRWRQEHKLL